MKKVLFYLCAGLLGIVLVPVFGGSESAGLSATPAPRWYTFSCASNDFYRHFCALDGAGRVQIARQMSEAPCIYGRTWGFTRYGVWVDRGCRADFVVTAREWDDDDSYRRARVLYCASDDFGFHGCSADTLSGVRIIRQRSEAPCIYGRSWGYDERGVWVDRGCRADFEIAPQYQRYDGDWDGRPY
jgi:hypothetical protein